MPGGLGPLRRGAIFMHPGIALGPLGEFPAVLLQFGEIHGGERIRLLANGLETLTGHDLWRRTRPFSLWQVK